MASESLQAWIDNPPLAVPPLSIGDWLLLMWPWLLLSIMLAILLRWISTQPRLRIWRGLLGIRRDMTRNRLQERQALFALARLLQHSASYAQRKALPAEIDSLLLQRFNKSVPSQSEVLALIQDLQIWIRG